MSHSYVWTEGDKEWSGLMPEKTEQLRSNPEYVKVKQICLVPITISLNQEGSRD